uniref:NB-ARC domain-containing protein n=1 Tax=Setaria italica TaxID=4555 RepID=K3ZLG5_SETIT
WIAKVFIQNEQATTEIELFELGEGYFNELINRSMIQPMELEDNGYVYVCGVHDMVLDLVRSLSSEENLATILDNNDQQKLIGGSNTRRFAVHGRSVEEHNRTQLLPEGVRLLKQLLCLHVNDSIIVPSCLIRNLTSLQELKLVKDLTIHVNDESMERDLLESLANLHKIRTLCVFGSALVRGITGEEACFEALPLRLGQMCLECFKFSALPVWMDSTLLLNLTHLDVTVNLVQEQDMETLGRLPELCYLKLSSDHTKLLSIRKTTGDHLHRYFRKLRFFHTPFSFVQFDSHSCERDNDATTAPSIVMPSLESLVFSVYVRFIKDMDIIQPGFENVAGTSLQRVTATIQQCEDATAAEVEEGKAALAHAADLHPNCPTLRIEMENKHKMLSTEREVLTY